MSQPKTITPAQLRCIGAITGKMNISKDDKAVMVKGFTNGRAESSKDLLYDEAVEMIKHLKANDPEEKKCQPMRNKILYYAYLIGWTKKSKQGKTVTDVQRVDQWMQRYSYLKKKLYSYHYNELPKLVTQFEYMYNDILKKM
jgi:hypothetical protein